MNNPIVVLRYSAKNGRRVSRSAQHKDLWLITTKDGIGWFSIHAGQLEVLKRNPPKGQVTCQGHIVEAEWVRKQIIDASRKTEKERE